MANLFHYPLCPRSRFIRAVMSEYGFEPELIEEKPYERRRDFLIANPSGDLPVLVDAGVGTPSDAVLAMELGCDAVLMNTAIAGAKDPILMASAMKHAVIAGRQGYLAGRMPRRMYASASSPMAGLI